MPKEGQVWPLQLVFLVLLILAILGFFAPHLFAGDASASKSAAVWFGAGALIAGCLLYIPVAVTWYRTRPELLRWMSAIGHPQAPRSEPDTIIGRLDAIQTQAGAINSAIGGLQAVQKLVRAIGDPDRPGDAPNSIAGRLLAIQAQAVPVGDVNTARTVLQRLAAIETKLGDIEANLSKKLDEFRKLGS